MPLFEGMLVGFHGGEQPNSNEQGRWFTKGFPVVAMLPYFCALLLVPAQPTHSPSVNLVLNETVLLKNLSLHVRTKEDHLAVGRGIAALASDNFEEREMAEATLVRRGRAALVSLQNARTNPDPEVAKRVLRCLEQIDLEKERNEILSAIKQLKSLNSKQAWPLVVELAAQAERSAERDELIEAALAFEPTEPLAWANRLATSERVSDRLLAFRLWRSLNPEHHQIAGMLQDPDREIRLVVSRHCTSRKDVRALICLAGLTESINDIISDEANECLMTVSGQASQRYPGGWRGWLAAGLPGLDWSRLSPSCQDRGFALIVLFDGEEGGRVTRIGPEGVIVGDVRGLLGPNDVEVLPGGRLLIAERNAGKVTERDRRGNIVWEYAMAGSPISAIRTDRATTVIATFRDLIEVDMDGRMIHFISHPGGFRAVRRNGNSGLAAVTGDGHLLILNHEWRIQSDAVIKNLAHGAGYWCGLEALPDGKWLVALGGCGRVAEIDATGQVLWQAVVPTPVCAHRLANGNTLVGSFEKKMLIEINREGNEVQRHELKGRPFQANRH